MSLTVEQMRYLADKGLTLEEVIEFAEMLGTPARSVAAERQARYRARQKEQSVTESVTRDVTRDVTDRPLSRPPNENNSNPPTHTPGDIYPARKGPDFPMLDCTDPATWADFLKNRKAKRLPNTASAHRKLKADLAGVTARTGWPPGEVFAACVAKGWGAIYDPRDKTDAKQSTGNRQPLIDIARTVAADLERQAAARAGY